MAVIPSRVAAFLSLEKRCIVRHLDELRWAKLPDPDK
jgi:hypothetical protein